MQFLVEINFYFYRKKNLFFLFDLVAPILLEVHKFIWIFTMVARRSFLLPTTLEYWLSVLLIFFLSEMNFILYVEKIGFSNKPFRVICVIVLMMKLSYI